MRKLIGLIFAWFVSCGFVQAQVLPSRPVVISMLPELTVKQTSELNTWLAAMQKWKVYDQKWFNKVPKGNNDRVLTRKQMPSEPVWLAAMCQPESSVNFYSPNLKLACGYHEGTALYSQLDAKAEEITLQIQDARSNHEKVRKTSFLTRLHMDALSTQSQLGNGPRLYGLVGSHISLVDVGRVQFYGPPGIVLISSPNLKGKRTMRFGYTWGMSVRLSDFHVPGSGGHDRNATLYLNLTKCWVNAGTDLAIAQVGGMDMIGFSLSPFKKEK